MIKHTDFGREKNITKGSPKKVSRHKLFTIQLQTKLRKCYVIVQFNVPTQIKNDLSTKLLHKWLILLPLLYTKLSNFTSNKTQIKINKKFNNKK